MAIVINGMEYSLPDDPRVSLLDLLRERLGLTGTKVGCNQGACGACTVLIDGERVLSCLTLAVQADGRSVTTIEGLSGADVTFIRCSPPSSRTTGCNAAIARRDRSCPPPRCFAKSKRVCRATSRPTRPLRSWSRVRKSASG